jgi:PLP dependent protein
MPFEHIFLNIKDIRREIPGVVTLVAAAKTRTVAEIEAAIDAGITAIGENYVQEAADVRSLVSRKVEWRFIGHLQKNKVRRAVELFDVIETVDSDALAMEINKRCRSVDKVMSVLVEINSGEEAQKTGVAPKDAFSLAKRISGLSNIKLQGLMTMGPFSGDPEDARPYFRRTREVFEEIRSGRIGGVEMLYLSMGMTNSYRVAIEEGANVIRVGTKIFGERKYGD